MATSTPGSDAPKGVGGAERGLRRRPGYVLLTGLALLVAGCATGRTINPFDENSRSGGPDQITIVIDNQSFNDFRAYAITIRGQRLVGQVPSKSQRTFTLDWERLDQIRLRLEFLAAQTQETNSVDAAPGDRLEAVVPPQMRGIYLQRRIGG